MKTYTWPKCINYWYYLYCSSNVHCYPLAVSYYPSLKNIFSQLKVGMNFNALHSEGNIRCHIVGTLQLLKIWINLNFKSKSRLARYMYQSSSQLGHWEWLSGVLYQYFKAGATKGIRCPLEFTLEQHLTIHKTKRHEQICNHAPKEKYRWQVWWQLRGFNVFTRLPKKALDTLLKLHESFVTTKSWRYFASKFSHSLFNFPTLLCNFSYSLILSLQKKFV